jgi:pimeloyl-ACP methyl ester carboxylesterase
MLNYKKQGQGRDFVIIHGLFGSLDNWQTLAKQLSAHFCVWSIDQRNHGNSLHSSIHNYQALAEDLEDFLQAQGIKNPIILGHSMGGKTVMAWADRFAKGTEKLIVADISPRAYPMHHGEIFSAINAIDLNHITSRKDAEDIARMHIAHEATRLFILRSLYWEIPNEKLAWRFNAKALESEIHNVIASVYPKKPVAVPVLFLRGAESNYMTEADCLDIQKYFPNAQIKTIPNAGHWLHAEQPALFLAHVLQFSQS